MEVLNRNKPYPLRSICNKCPVHQQQPHANQSQAQKTPAEPRTTARLQYVLHPHHQSRLLSKLRNLALERRICWVLDFLELLPHGAVISLHKQGGAC